MSEPDPRDALCRLGASLFGRGLSHGSSGNLSLRTDDGYLLTPTGASLGALDPA
ncbi:MAG: class II aldolase/adducin family protein, partial [Betaproteobacteria bacterium]